MTTPAWREEDRKGPTPARWTDQLIVYKPDYLDDVLIVDWWKELHHLADFEEAFGKRTLGEFIKLFQEPNGLIYSIDPKVWFAAWFENVMSGVAMGVWIREDMRHTKAAWRMLMRSLEQATALWPVVLSVTRQPKVVDQLVKLGYTPLGNLPRFYRGSDGWIGYITKESFEEANPRWAART